MATDFPTGLDALTNPTASDQVDSVTVPHATQHANANDAIEALEAKVGIDSSAVTTSHDYKLSGVTASDKSASLAGTETLTNKTIDADNNTISNLAPSMADTTGADVLFVSGTAGANTQPALWNADGDVIGGTVPVAYGGTGATTQTEGFDALSPTTTKGDVIVSNGSDNIRLAVGSNDEVLIADSAQASGVKWGAVQDALLDKSVKLTLSGDFQLNAVSVDTGIDWDTESFDDGTMHDVTGDTAIYNEATDDQEHVMPATTDYSAQEFTTGASDYNVVGGTMTLRHSVDDANDVEIVLRSSLTGSDLATTGTVNFDGTGTSSTVFSFNFDYIVSPSTTYYIVLKPINMPSGQFAWRENSAGTGGHSSSDSGASWSSTTDGFRATINTNPSRYITLPTTGKYLVIANIASGVSSDKTIKLKNGNTTIYQYLSDAGTTERGAQFTTLVDATANDLLTLTVNSATSAADDILANGSTFEAILIR